MTDQVIAPAPSHTPWRTTFLWVGVGLWLLAPIALFGWLWWAGQDTALEQETIVTVPVRANEEPVAREAQLALSWSTAPSLVAPQWSGIVQRVSASPGSAVSSGDVMAVIGGVGRVAYHSPVPFSATLSPGAHGPEVAQLNTFLRERGYSAATADVYDSRTTAAVRAFARDIGAGGSVQFDPGWVIYMPAPAMTVESIELVVGAPAPAAGTPVVVGSVRLEAATLQVYRPDDVNSVEGAAAGTTAPSAPLFAESGESVQLGSEVLPLIEDGASVTPEALIALSDRVLESARAVKVTLVSPSTPGEWVVPAAAIVSSGSDPQTTCVVVDRGGRFEAVAVTVGGGRQGATIVDGALNADDRVLVAPALELRACE